jgi:hypothetical protein
MILRKNLRGAQAFDREFFWKLELEKESLEAEVQVLRHRLRTLRTLSESTEDHNAYPMHILLEYVRKYQGNVVTFLKDIHQGMRSGVLLPELDNQTIREFYHSDRFSRLREKYAEERRLSNEMELKLERIEQVRDLLIDRQAFRAAFSQRNKKSRRKSRKKRRKPSRRLKRRKKSRSNRQ